VGEFGHQSVVLMSVALPMSQDDRRIEIAFDRLEAILDIGALEGEISIAEPQNFDLFLRDVFEKGGRAVPRLDLAQTGAAEDDPSHDEIGRLGGKAQDRSATPDLDIVGVCTQAKQPQRPSPFGRKNDAKQAAIPPK
jgi:hypothetical protein